MTICPRMLNYWKPQLFPSTFWAFSILIFSLGLGTYYAHLNPICALFIVNVGVCKLAMKLQLCGWEAKACVTRMCEAALKAQALARLSDISTT